MIRTDATPSNHPQTDLGSTTANEPPQGGSEGPGSAGTQPGGTERAPLGVGRDQRPGHPPTAPLCAINPSPSPHTKPSQKCTPAARLRAAWCRPPLLIGGPKHQTHQQSPIEAVSTCLDWLTATGAISDLESVRALVAATWRVEAAPERRVGRHGYDHRDVYAPGVEINWTPTEGQGNEGICIEVSGSGLSELDDDAQYRLAYAIMQLGLRPTRVDLALDVLWERPTDLLDKVYDGSRGIEVIDAQGTRRIDVDPTAAQPEMMGFRTMSQTDRHKHGKRMGRTIYFGARGKEGGGCQWVLYDKGREQKLAETGIWTRAEARFYKRGELAHQVLSRICESPDGWREIALSLILAKVDFRAANGRTERIRRPRCEWWAQFLRDVRATAADCLTPVRKPARLVTTLAWAQRSVMPTLHVLRNAVREAGMDMRTLGTLVDSFFHDVGPTSQQRADTIAHQVRVALAGGDPENPLVALVAIARGGPPDGY